MIPLKVLIVSPDPALMGRIREALRTSHSPGRGLLLRRYPTTHELDGLLADYQPDIAVISLYDLAEGAALMRYLRDSSPHTTVVAAHTDLSPDTVLASIHAGAREYFGPPFEPKVLERILAYRGAGPKNGEQLGRQICFLPSCPGAGTSTLATHTAVALARKEGQRVLLVDFDFHNSSAEFRHGQPTGFHLAVASQRLDELSQLWGQATSRWHGVDLLPAPSAQPLRADWLNAVPWVLDSARWYYQWVICDLPDAVHPSTARALLGARNVFLVCTPELVSLEVARRRAADLVDLGLAAKRLSVVLSRMPKWTPIGPDEVADTIRLPVCFTIPNDFSVVTDSNSSQRPVSAESALGRAFHAFAEQLTAPLEEKFETGPSWTSSLVNLMADLFTKENAAKLTRA